MVKAYIISTTSSSLPTQPGSAVLKINVVFGVVRDVIDACCTLYRRCLRRTIRVWRPAGCSLERPDVVPLTLPYWAKSDVNDGVQS